MKSQLGRKKKIIPVALHAVIYFIFLSKPHIHTFPLPTARQIFAYQFCCKLQIEFSRCLCRPHLSDDFIAFMEPFVTQLLLSCFVLGFFFLRLKHDTDALNWEQGKGSLWDVLLSASASAPDAARSCGRSWLLVLAWCEREPSCVFPFVTVFLPCP